jgi:dienelactone hydrolase
MFAAIRDIRARRGRFFDGIDTVRIWLRNRAKDRGNRGTARRLEELLTDLGFDHDIKVYPGAGHSFLSDLNPAEAPAIVVVLAKLSGATFHELSAAHARHRIIDFFDVHLNRITGD